ncbi:truncated ankyrin-like protein [Yokapox virus]|uniref:Truncated ankyrin-like protein n=1 Tax=Yokapox virus TaxID=1076255 RepID=G3EI64_9POXV|nr:truncated ankyrin-like protein [Yokapox virus]AEN03761.1 truncated ankyrin-like protein [Yokapox virus]
MEMYINYIFSYIKSENINIQYLENMIDENFINVVKDDLNILETYATTRNPDPNVFKMLLDKKIPICSNVSYGKFMYYDDYMVNDYIIIDDFDDLYGKTVLYYYITTRHLYDSEISLDVIKVLKNNSYMIENYSYDGKTVVQYYVKEDIVKRDIFNELFNITGKYNNSVNILYDYLTTHIHNIDTYILEKILEKSNNYNILFFLYNLDLKYNRDVLLIILSYFDKQYVLTNYIRNTYDVRIDIIECIIESGGVLHRFKSINDYLYNVYNKKSDKFINYVFKNGISNDEDDNKISMCKLLCINENVMDEERLVNLFSSCINHVDVNEKDSYGNTLLYYAIKFSRVKIVKILLDNNADVNLQLKDKRTCLDIAISRTWLGEKDYRYKNTIDILEMILKELPNVNKTKNTLIYNIYTSDRVIKLCIKYYMLVDKNYVMNNIHMFEEYKNKCVKEIDQLMKPIYMKKNLFDLVYKNKNICIHELLKYAKNPRFIANYEIYTEANDIVRNVIEKNEQIYKTIEEISVDNNYMSLLPFDLQYMILSYTIK